MENSINKVLTVEDRVAAVILAASSNRNVAEYSAEQNIIIQDRYSSISRECILRR